MTMDIIVTTPKSQMANAAQEAADCIENGGGEYFRRADRPPGTLGHLPGCGRDAANR